MRIPGDGIFGKEKKPPVGVSLPGGAVAGGWGVRREPEGWLGHRSEPPAFTQRARGRWKVPGEFLAEEKVMLRLRLNCAHTRTSTSTRVSMRFGLTLTGLSPSSGGLCA